MFGFCSEIIIEAELSFQRGAPGSSSEAPAGREASPTKTGRPNLILLLHVALGEPEQGLLNIDLSYLSQLIISGPEELTWTFQASE